MNSPKFQKEKETTAHLKDFHHHLLIVHHIYGLKDFTVLPSTQLTDQLIVVLITKKEIKKINSKKYIEAALCSDQ